MPYTNKDHYPVRMLHEALYNLNIEADIIPCDQWSDFSHYQMLLIPPLYVANDELLNKIDAFVKNGGQVIMLFKSGYCNEHSAVRAMLAPGPLRKACGFYYQEYSTIPAMSLKDNPFQLQNPNAISEWYEFLIPETAQPLAYADHPFFGKWPVITENRYGNGKLTYIGAYPSQELLEKIVSNVAKEAKITDVQNEYHFPVIFRSGMNTAGKKIHYVFNYSKNPQEIRYPFPAGKELFSGEKMETGKTVTLNPWDVKIIEE